MLVRQNQCECDGERVGFDSGDLRSDFLCRIVVAFDIFFNMADASNEAFAAIFVNSQDGSEFHDVAVSARIIEKLSLHSFYFFSSSAGLYFRIKHNSTQIPASNFVRRSMQVDEVVEALQTNGFKSLFVDNSIPTTPSASDASNVIYRNFRLLNSQYSGNSSSSTSSLQNSNQVTARSCF